jgi:hypothetical protein
MLIHELGHVLFMSNSERLWSASVEQEYAANQFWAQVSHELGALAAREEARWLGPQHDAGALRDEIHHTSVIFRTIMVQVFSPILVHPVSPKLVHRFSPKVVQSFSPKLVQGDNSETPSSEAYFPFWNQRDWEGVCQARGRRPWTFERC